MAHIHEKIDFTVEVFIVHGNRVLLRLHDTYNKWLSVGGHIELDEDPTQAALREVKEEVGLDVVLVGAVAKTGENTHYKELLSPRFMNIHAVSDTHQHISLIYFAASASNQVIPEKPTDQWKWLTREELANMDISKAIRHYAKTALDEVHSK